MNRGDRSSSQNYPDPSWWTVIGGGQDGDPRVRRAALDRLFARYRKPILHEIMRRFPCSETRAEDLTQQLLADWYRRDFLKNVSRERGRFRTFVRRCIQNYLNEVRRKDARDAMTRADPLDPGDDAGERRHDPVAAELAPDVAFDVHWARQLVGNAFETLELECRVARRHTIFQALRPTLLGDASDESDAALATRLGTTPGALKQARFRLRRRLNELIEGELASTVTEGENWREERDYLIEILGRHGWA